MMNQTSGPSSEEGTRKTVVNSYKMTCPFGKFHPNPGSGWLGYALK